ncbi:MAG: MFS transporter [Alphaproteobacteria bacterium]|nr:MFS transporter [Alphaproteobacteria bacterium]
MAVFSLPALVLAALGLPLSMYLPNLYVENVGIPATAAGTVFMLLRFWDVVTDPTLGVISDRFAPPFGRRRSWVVASVPILAVSVWMAFVPLPGADALYLALWLFVLYVGYTMIQIAHLAWSAELAHDAADRGRLLAWREIAVVIGIVLVLLVAAITESGVPRDMVQEVRADAVRGMALFIVILLPLTVGLAVAMVPEPRHETMPITDWRAAALAVVRNPGLARLVVSDVLYKASTAVTGTLFLWFMAARLDLARFASLALLLYFVAALIGMPVWMWITRHIGKRRAYIASVIVPALMVFPLLFLGGVTPLLPGGEMPVRLDLGFVAVADTLTPDQIAGLIGVILYGVNYGAAPYLARALCADIADADYRASGQRRTGMFYSFLTLTEKTGYAVGVGFSLIMLDIVGFETGRGASNSAEAEFALACLYVIPTVVLLIAAGIVMMNFRGPGGAAGPERPKD